MRCLHILFCLALCGNAAAQAVLKFKDKKIKFSEIKAGPKLSFDFFFSNHGDLPLQIQQIKTNCHCTTFTYPKHPIMPGDSDTIHVTFDTKNKIGWQYRILEIYSNSKTSPDKIQFYGKVIPL